MKSYGFYKIIIMLIILLSSAQYSFAVFIPGTSHNSEIETPPQGNCYMQERVDAYHWRCYTREERGNKKNEEKEYSESPKGQRRFIINIICLFISLFSSFVLLNLKGNIRFIVTLGCGVIFILNNIF